MTPKKLGALAVLRLFVIFRPATWAAALNTSAARLLKFPSAARERCRRWTIGSSFFTAGKASWRVPYEKINLVEYGEKVDRRYIAAVLISPLFLLAKKRQHFLTVGYSDEEDRQQAMIFKINKDDIRATLVVLEARTGRKVEYQDDDARKSGKG